MNDVDSRSRESLDAVLLYFPFFGKPLLDIEIS